MYATAYIWAKVLSYLEKQLSEITVSAWLDDAELVMLDETQLVLYSPSEFRQEIIREKCAAYIEDALREVFQMRVKLVVWGDSELHRHKENKQKCPVPFNPQFTFDNYVTGESNLIATKIAQAAANDPGNDVYNPLFIYGPPGVGKTHLLYAVANHVQAAFPEKNIVYVKGDQFTNELVTAIRTGTTESFKRKYRYEPDVFLIDDIQFIAGKESTQEEFFHTFNELFEGHRQIVMTADRKPGDMATLEDRLRGRFGAGIMVAISPPDRDTRVSIIRAKARKLQLQLDSETIQYMADNLTQNVRQIEGSLKKLRVFRDLCSMELTTANVARTLEDICNPEAKITVTASLILRHVCRYFGVDSEILKSTQKCRGVSEPRQIAMYLMRTMMNLSFSEIGALFGNRDHSTVQHSVRKIEAILSTKGNSLAGVIQDITANIENAMN